MKLIYIANARIPTEKAHGIQIMKMCEAFSKSKFKNQKSKVEEGVEVEFVAPRRRNHIKADPFEYYGVERIFKIKKLPCFDLVQLVKIGFFIQTVTFLISAKMYLLLKKYDILYTREQLVGLFFKNFVLEVHYFPKKTKWIHRFIWGRAKSLIVLTSFIKKRFVEEGIDENKIFIAPDGVNINEFDIKIAKEDVRKKFNLPQDKILIGYVGMLKNMWMEKGVGTAIESLEFLDAKTLLVVVGGHKNDIDYYQNLSRKLGFKNRILFIGRVSHAFIPYYLKAFDVLIAPFPALEYYKFYLSPLKLFEYMVSGRPIVASDLPSIREILNENNSILVEPGNPGALAEGIKKVLQNPDLADRISKQALEDVKNYTWQKRAERILKFTGH